jgi:uncharacterized protein YacL
VDEDRQTSHRAPGPGPATSTAPRRGGGTVAIELVRLTVVVLATAGAHQLGRQLRLGDVEVRTQDELRLLLTVLGAGIGYVAGGMFGRFTWGRIDAAERRLRGISSGELLAGLLGGFAGLAVAGALTWPLLLFDAKVFTVPVAVLIVLIATTLGVRIGVGRGGDLLRALGVSGRLEVTSPSTGPRAKLVDTSALIDGRLLDVCRAGFLEGTLVIPQFVLYELQGLADSGDDDRRQRGRRGLDVVAALQRSSGVGFEVSDRDHPEVAEVDAKLIAMARSRKLSLVTVDANLARVAEIQDVKVLNLHALAEQLRPPVLPGDLVAVRIVKAGKEPGQGVGYLSDGTMVVVEQARDAQGSEVSAEVTSILSNANGRMVFATVRSSATPLPRRSAVR